jgi:SPP1 family predicted phage head-tail adaptor
VRADRDKKITISSKNETQNSFGEMTYTLTAVHSNIWASFEPLIGQELFLSAQTHPKLTGKFRIEYMTGIDENMIVTFGTRTFDITGPPINYKEQNRELILMVEELM